MLRLSATLVFAALIAPLPSAGETTVPFTEEQASRGAGVYKRECAYCHGPQLWDGAASPLAGSDFRAIWSADDKTLYDLYQVTQSTMPVNAEGTLSPATMADLLAFLLRENGYPAGDEPLPPDPEALKAIRLTPGE